jgi:NADPH:quinone reductase-like Zn-dependent oxidoreductase
MRAVEYDRYGPPDVLQVREVDMPVAGPGQIQVHVAAASVNPKDALVRRGRFRHMAGAKFPKRTGCDFAGTVTAVGAGVTGFSPGEEVFGMLNGWSGGACAETVVAAAGELARKPTALTLTEAAALPLVAQTALQALRDIARLKSGQRVCIHGASGGVGTVAVQIAKCLGAQVTATCGEGSTTLVRSLGADVVVDYRRVPPPKLGGPFECFFDVFGDQSFAGVKHLLVPHGTYVTTVPKSRNLLDHLLTLLSRRQRARMAVVKSKSRDLATIAAWADEQRLKPVLARILALEQIRTAHEMIETKATHGKIVLTIDSPRAG